jgi:hypothetical protein
MDRDQLDVRNTAAIRRHWRTLTDNGGVPPRALLDQLAEIAHEHAMDVMPRPVIEQDGPEKPPVPAPSPSGRSRTATAGNRTSAATRRTSRT